MNKNERKQRRKQGMLKTVITEAMWIGADAALGHLKIEILEFIL